MCRQREEDQAGAKWRGNKNSYECTFQQSSIVLWEGNYGLSKTVGRDKGCIFEQTA